MRAGWGYVAARGNNDVKNRAIAAALHHIERVKFPGFLAPIKVEVYEAVDVGEVHLRMHVVSWPQIEPTRGNAVAIAECLAMDMFDPSSPIAHTTTTHTYQKQKWAMDYRFCNDQLRSMSLRDMADHLDARMQDQIMQLVRGMLEGLWQS